MWVSQRVKHDLDQWKKENFTPQISINLHPHTLMDSKSIHTIIETLRGEDIVFEILEKSFIFGDKSIENLKKLQKEGFLISIDDFGVGYSNLETLLQHAFQEIKLDKALVDSIEERRGYLVCSKIIELCRDLGYRVVVEGVETAAQYRLAKEAGADLIQGFYFSAALPPDQARQFALRLAQQNRHRSPTSH